jgi:HEAT repeat protein
LAALAGSGDSLSPALLAAVAEVLGNFSQSGDLLITLLAHAQPDVRSRAADAVGKIAPKLGNQTAERLITALAERLSIAEERPYVRAASALALGEIARPEAVAPLARALLEDDDALVRRRAAEALQRLAHAQALPALERALADADEGVTNAAWNAMRAIAEAAEAPEPTLITLAERWLAEGSHARFALKVFQERLAGLPKENNSEERAGLERRIARCYMVANDHEAALAALEALHTRDPRDAAVILWLASTLVALPPLAERQQRALSLLETLGETPADDSQWRGLMLRVRILQQRGDVKNARALMVRLRAFDPQLGGKSYEATWQAIEATLAEEPGGG